MITRRRFLRLGAEVVGLTLMGGAFTILDHPFNPVRAADVPADPVLRDARRVGIVAPHPDDELLGPGGLAAQAARSGARVDVLLLTMGDGFRLDAMRVFETARPTAADFLALGERRHQESRRGMRALGLDPERLSPLGFPDRGSDHLWYGDWSARYPSPTTGADQAPYAEVARPGAPYTGLDYLEGISAWLDAVQPDLLLLPHPNDEHPDHRYGYCFSAAALDRLLAAGRAWVGQVRRLTYLVHWGRWNMWPLPFGYHPQQPLVPPSQLLGCDLSWERRVLPPEIQDLKYRATASYRTQMALVPDFLLAFARGNELFSRDEPYHVPLLADAGDLAGLRPAVRNPRMGFLKDLSLRAADFGPVVVARTRDRLWVRIGFTEARPPGGVSARVAVFGFTRELRPQGVEADVRVLPTAVETVRRMGPGGGSKLDLPVSARMHGGALDVGFPLSAISDASRFLLGVRSFSRGRLAAASGSRRFSLETA